MTPFARYLLEQRWKILFTAQGIFMASLYYARFAANPVGPLKALKPNADLKVDEAHAAPVPRQQLEDNSGADVSILSVTQLVELLNGGTSRRAELEARHIQYYDISPEPSNMHSRSFKRPRAEANDRATTSAISFWSERVWITGFLHYEQVHAKPRNATLCLSDAAHWIPVHVVYPALELLDGIVLVKAWTVVQRLLTTGADAASRSMEVHDEPTLLHHPHGQPGIPLDEAIATVRTHYTIRDPPMFAGWKTWESLKSEEMSTAMPTTPRGASKKKRKVHVVLGRITSVSPISVQDDASNSHFFMEIEQTEDQPRTRSIVNILLAGPTSIKWHPFLWPGLLVLVTNLKKVYSAESEMFLLQTQFNDGSPDGNSSLFLWRLSSGTPRPHAKLGASLMDPHCISAIGTTVNLEGVVTAVVWDDCLVLESEIPVLIALFHYPWAEMRDCVRVGSRIHVFHAHVLHRSSFSERRRVGLCSRSHIRVAAHAPASSEVSLHRYGDHRRRLHKKWSLFGDFSRQSLAVSMWWLDLLEVLVQKFRFQTDKPRGMRGAAFACVRRREATLALGQDIFSASSGQSLVTHSLARRFLNAHNENDQDCPSVINKGTRLPEFISTRALTLRDIESSIKRLAHAKIAAAADQGERLAWPIQIEARELTEICAIGVLRGCDGASDLEIMDQSAILPVILDTSGATSICIDKGCSMYAFRTFSALVEICEDKADAQEAQALVVSLCVSRENVQRVTLCSTTHREREIDGSGETRCSVVVFVTHIGPWKRRHKMQSIVGDFRHVRGVGFRSVSENDSSMNWDSAHAVELLVSTECESWFIHMHSWYKFDGVREITSSQTSAGEAALVHRWSQMRANAEAPHDVKTPQAFDEKPVSAMKNGDEQTLAASYMVDACCTVLLFRLLSTRPSLVEAGINLVVDESAHRCVASMEELALQSRTISQVHDLFVIDRPEEDSEVGGAESVHHADLHATRLINLVGVVKERQLYLKHATLANKPHGLLRGESREPSGRKLSRLCRLKIRSMHSLEAVFVTVDMDLFGTMSVLQPGTVVEISMIQCFIARTSFKPFLTWTHCTTARRLGDPTAPVVGDGHLFSQMQTTHLHALYKNHGIDRTIHRFVVQLAHLSYAVIKRRCSQCKQPLTLLKRQQAWVHAAALVEEGNAPSHRRCPWTQITQDSPLFHQNTFVSCSLRGIIDDGSAQAELFLENDIVWELLPCSRSQRQRFENLLERHTSDLSYFAARSSVAALFTSPSMQENLYYQNEWRAFVQTTVSARGAVVVFAQRFYKPAPANAAPPTAVLTFGKDIQITTPSVPLLQLEAVRIDALNARHELRRRLALHQSGTRHHEMKRIEMPHD